MKNLGNGSENLSRLSSLAHLTRCGGALALTALFALTFAGCQRPHGPAESEKHADGQIWTCPMHPSIRSPKPGACPICGMDLVPAGSTSPSPQNSEATQPKTHSSEPTPEKALAPMAEGSQLYLSPEKQQALGVTFGEVLVRNLARQANAPLRFEPDPAGITEISIKAGGGFVVSVDIGFPGQEVKKGQRLLTVLSEGWIEAQQAYLLAFRDNRRYSLENKNANLNAVQAMLSRTRQRIRLWDLSEDQITDLEKIATESSEWDVTLARKIKNNLEIRSPMDGYVLEKNVVAGMRFESGQKLLLLAPRTPLWGMAAFTPEDAARISVGDQVTFTVDTLPGVELRAPVDHVDPVTDPQTRRIYVHLKINDPRAQLRPGQTGAASLSLPSVSVLSLPSSALLPLGRDQVVFINRGKGHLEPRRIQIGERFGEMVEVRSGLKAGDQVATSANFLLDSEARLKGILPIVPQENP